MVQPDESAEPKRGPTARVLAVLVALSKGDASRSLGEVAADTGLAKPTVLRLLRVLQQEGFASQDTDTSWRLTSLVFELGCSAVGLDDNAAAVRAGLRSIADMTGESAVYAVHDSGYTVYVETVESSQPVRTSVSLGTRVPALATATGRAMVAWLDPAERDRLVAKAASAGPSGEASGVDGEQLRHELDRIRHDGYAVNSGGLWPGVWGIGAPVFDRFGHVVGAVGMSAPHDRRPDDLTEAAAAVMKGAALASAPTVPTRIRR